MFRSFTDKFKKKDAEMGTTSSHTRGGPDLEARARMERGITSRSEPRDTTQSSYTNSFKNFLKRCGCIADNSKDNMLLSEFAHGKRPEGSKDVAIDIDITRGDIPEANLALPKVDHRRQPGDNGSVTDITKDGVSREPEVTIEVQPLSPSLRGESPGDFQSQSQHAPDTTLRNLSDARIVPGT